ncbi:hypothetical protein K440DRAFT_657788 [Wilcoxina mikolae CBS 423.85]|nr:hypothetical protein K440DRAFT_657788 [Wilcoxina mikolae CBS 423.85]
MDHQTTPPQDHLYTNFTACDACRKRKKRCDGRIAACQHCAQRGIQCVYTQRKSKPRSQSKPVPTPAPDIIVADLDDRLKRIEEAVFRNLELHNQAHENLLRHRSDSEDDEGESSDALTPRTAGPASPRFEGALDIISPCNFFIGMSSPFSFISLPGMKWVDSCLGNDSFSALLRRAQEVYVSYTEPPMPTGEYIETPELRDLYIHEYFTYLNPLTPLFSPNVFSSLPPTCPTTHAATSILLALGAQHLSRTSPSHLPAAAHYFSITSRLLPTVLLTITPDVPGIQSLLGMCLFYQESDDVQPHFTLLGLTTGMATQAGLHRNPRKLGFQDPNEIQQRINIWWILYTLDKEAALRTGRPSSIPDNDCDVPLPSTSTPSLLLRTKLAQTMSVAMNVIDDEKPGLQKQLEQWAKDTPLVLSRCWEENAMTLRVRWNCFCTMMSLGFEVEAWAREEARDVMKWRGPRTKAMLFSLACAAWYVFSKRVAEDGVSEDEEGQRLLEEIARCIRCNVWPEREGRKMGMLLLMLVEGMVEFSGRRMF